MEKRAVVVIAAAILLGLVAAVLGFAAEHFQHKAYVGSDLYRCEYRRTPALGCGIFAALLSLTAVTLVTAASVCFGRCGATAAAAEGSRRCACARTVCATLAWFQVVGAAATFLYGASRNAGGTGGFTGITLPPGRNNDGRDFVFVCNELRDGVFVSASINAAFAIGFAIAAYVDTIQLQRRNQTATLGVAMAQPPHPPPVAYPAQPPYGGYGAKQPAGTASA